MNASPLHFFEVFKQAVMFSPSNDWKCKQLQSFRVMRKNAGAMLQDSNLGATICDRTKPYFWSKAWHLAKYNPNKVVWEYPLLVISEKSFGVERPFDAVGKRTYDYQIAVVDRYTENCEKGRCEGCDGRTVDEIYIDTERLLFGALRFLSNSRYATVDGEEGVWNMEYLQYLSEEGEIGTYAEGKDFGGLIASANQQISGYRVIIEAAKVYGTAVNIKAGFKYCEDTCYDFAGLPEFTSLAVEAGCKNCG